MKTKKLYDIDSHMREFDATVLEVREEKNGCSVILDQTAFFPTGGGQDADRGTLNGFSLTDVRDEDGSIRHFVSGVLSAGDAVHGVLDWELRFNRMQHHSGEHIVSGLIHQKYGYENVGFHLTDASATLDFDGELTREQVEEIEYLANRAVWENFAVSAVYPDPETLKNLNYRSKLELTHDVRIVTFPGYDVCACCAPHVHHTGEIGCIKLTDVMRHRGGVRMTLYAGKNAYLDYADKAKNIQTISALLSAKQSIAAEAVTRVHTEYLQLKHSLAEAMKQLISHKAEQLAPTDGNILLFEEHLDVNTLRAYVNLVLPKCGGVCIGLSGNDGSGYTYIAASSSVDMRAFAKEFNAALHGKGGGKPEMIQGSLQAKRSEIEKYMNV